jgi:hypothetical protein
MGGSGMGGMGGGGNAPILDDEQMQQGMPDGHPDIGGMGEDTDAGDAEGDATPEAETP